MVMYKYNGERFSATTDNGDAYCPCTVLVCYGCPSGDTKSREEEVTDVIQGTLVVIQGTLVVIQGTSTMIQNPEEKKLLT
jgi:hypothetical protein